MTATMRSVRCTAYGEPESLVVEEGPRPEPGPGQVRLAIRAAGVNFVDNLFVAGTYQIRIPPPFTPGGEVAGVVEAVGEEVDDVLLGQRVVASVGVGGWASHLVTSARNLLPLPDALTDGQGATIVQSYATAWFSLHRRITVAPGERVLVLGAGGGIGLAFTDVARSLGAEVIAAASSAEKLEAAEAAGASGRIDYSSEDLKVRARELSGGGVDVVVDPVGGDLADPALRALGEDGRYLVIGFAGGSIPRLPANQILLRNRRVVGVDWGAWAMAHPEENRAMLDDLFAAAADGRVRPKEPVTYPLEQVAVALRSLLERQVTGKLALVP